MTTPKEAAAVALERTVRDVIEYLDSYGGGTGTCVNARNTLEQGLRTFRATPPPPDAVGLSEVEREYLEACYSAQEELDANPSMTSNEARWKTCQAFDALRRARQPEPLEEARALLEKMVSATAATWIQDDARAALRRIDAALAQKGGSR